MKHPQQTSKNYINNVNQLIKELQKHQKKNKQNFYVFGDVFSVITHITSDEGITRIHTSDVI